MKKIAALFLSLILTQFVFSQNTFQPIYLTNFLSNSENILPDEFFLSEGSALNASHQGEYVFNSTDKDGNLVKKVRTNFISKEEFRKNENPFYVEQVVVNGQWVNKQYLEYQDFDFYGRYYSHYEMVSLDDKGKNIKSGLKVDVIKSSGNKLMAELWQIFDVKSGKWINWKLFEYKTDKEGKVTEVLVKTFDNETGLWINSRKEILTYNENKVLKSREVQRYNNVSKTWQAIQVIKNQS